MCWVELNSFHNRKKFVGKHPFFTLDIKRRKLYELLNRNLKEFLEEYRSAANNVIRYNTLLAKSQKEEEKEKYQKIIKKHEDNILTIEQILNEHVSVIKATANEGV